MFICTGSVVGQVFHYTCKLQVKVQQGRVFSVQFTCILQTRFTDWRWELNASFTSPPHQTPPGMVPTLVQYKRIPNQGKSGAKLECSQILKLFCSCLKKEGDVGLSASPWLLISGVHRSWVLKDPHVVLSLLSWAAAEHSLLTLTFTRSPQWNQKPKCKPRHSGTMYRFGTVLGGLRILKSMTGLHWSIFVDVSSAIDTVLIGCFILLKRFRSPCGQAQWKGNYIFWCEKYFLRKPKPWHLMRL